jgi:hypothetical protein
MPGSALDLNRLAGSSELEEKDLWHAPCQFRIQPYNAIELNGEVPLVEDLRLDEVQHGAIDFWRSGSIKSNTISTSVRRLACSNQPLTFTKTSSKCQRQVTVTSARNVLP